MRRRNIIHGDIPAGRDQGGTGARGRRRKRACCSSIASGNLQSSERRVESRRAAEVRGGAGRSPGRDVARGVGVGVRPAQAWCSGQGAGQMPSGKPRRAATAGASPPREPTEPRELMSSEQPPAWSTPLRYRALPLSLSVELVRAAPAASSRCPSTVSPPRDRRRTRPPATLSPKLLQHEVDRLVTAWRATMPNWGMREAVRAPIERADPAQAVAPALAAAPRRTTPNGRSRSSWTTTRSVGSMK